jgi:hypothetical protein
VEGVGQLARRRAGGGVVGGGVVGEVAQHPAVPVGATGPAQAAGGDRHCVRVVAEEVEQQLAEAGHVVAGSGVGRRERRPEPAQHGTVAGPDDHVVGLESPVDDSDLVEVGHRAGQGDDQAGGPLGGDGGDGGEGVRPDPAQGQLALVVAGGEVDQLDHARVAGGSQSFGLDPESVEVLR